MFNIGQYKIPTEFIAGADMTALENYINLCESYLSIVAMESSGSSEDLYTSMTMKAKNAGKKIIEGQKKNDPSMIAEGNSELTRVTQQLVNENKKANSFAIKTKLILVAKAIVAIIGSILLAFGLYHAGKAVKNLLHGKTTKSDMSKAITAVHQSSNDPVLNDQISSIQSSIEDSIRKTEQSLKEVEGMIVETRNVGRSQGTPLIRDSNGKLVDMKIGSNVNGGTITRIEDTDDPNVKSVTSKVSKTKARELGILVTDGKRTMAITDQRDFDKFMNDPNHYWHLTY